MKKSIANVVGGDILGDPFLRRIFLKKYSAGLRAGFIFLNKINFKKQQKMNKFFLFCNNKSRHKNKGGRKLKATGVVRRIDDLGRIVIPKEIRKTLRIKEGDPFKTTLEQLRVVTESLKLLAS